MQFASARAAMAQNDLPYGGVHDARVLVAMASVPRELFVPPAIRHLAYADHPLPIGFGQTISQPLMVGLMLQALELRGTERVLDVGTGSGYQAALLGRLSREVWSIEIQPDLAESARAALLSLEAENVFVVCGDGSLGWAERAPYDAIVVAAASSEIPVALTRQLASGGRLVFPLGDPARLQMLVRIRKDERGLLSQEQLGACAFVPLVGAGVPD